MEMKLILSDEEFLRTPTTSERFYLNSGKIICKDFFDVYTWFKADSPIYLFYGQLDEVRCTNPITELSDEDKAELAELIRLSAIVDDFGIAPVAIPKTEKGWVLLVHKEAPYNFFLCELDALEHKFNSENAQTLLNCKEERPADAPYCVQQVFPDIVIAY